MTPSIDYPAYAERPGLSLPSQTISKSLGETTASSPRPLSPAQDRAVLIVALTCASLSLLAALVALRWFLLMRRSYRHHLILFWIVSDAWKALWFFIFPLVVFSRGKVESSSLFCHASGFFLALGMEASDFAILMIALHAILYVFQRPRIRGEGGLYPYRKYIYPLWIGLPVLSASLAFTNPQNAYVTSGTICYLPKRPFWYRLVLTWIPRYLIFITILSMYGAIYLYVHVKFRAFTSVGNENSAYSSGSGSYPLSSRDKSQIRPQAAEPPSTEDRTLTSIDEDTIKEFTVSQLGPVLKQDHPPWEDVDFITSKPMRDPDEQFQGTTGNNLGSDFGSSSTSPQMPSGHLTSRSLSGESQSVGQEQPQSPEWGTSNTGETARSSMATNPTVSKRLSSNKLQSSRNAIRRQLRLLFIYPAVYLLMWAFPFASHCLQYNNYYVTHPPFWLSIVSTSFLALQSAVDCAVFSWKEKPWRRIPKGTPGAFGCLAHIITGNARRADKYPVRISTVSDVDTRNPKRDSHWWEAEGRKREDSVWLGTDTTDQTFIRKAGNELQREEPTVPIKSASI